LARVYEEEVALRMSVSFSITIELEVLQIFKAGVDYGGVTS
jgi:hypothetical protein